MQIEYTIITTETGGEVITTTDSSGNVSFIPTDPANSDYQAYLASLEDKVE